MEISHWATDATALIVASIIVLIYTPLALQKLGLARLVRWMSSASLAVALSCVSPQSAHGLTSRTPSEFSAGVRNDSRAPDPWSSSVVQTSQAPPFAPSTSPQLKPVSTTYNRDSTSDAMREPYRVVAGDNLWTIARRLIHENESVEKLWRSIIAENEHNLRSRNRNLIYPGEEILVTHLS